ncbi:Phosphatidylinositol N-acetylglucosaminyltransferase GPI2 subunit [Pseudozyma hubeiensis]|nr:Phosphatidylinositol N-acetylglucosaminyltransferase GPI2 subunit [Pseudozyma hubeiensis]
MTHSARPVEAGTTATAGKEVPFEKVLWRKQPFADNFVPPTFLSDLRTNSQVILPSLTQLMLASLRISTRFLHVILYTLWFVHLHLGTVDAELVLLLGGAAVALYTLVHVHVFISSADPPQPKQRDERRGKKIISKIIIAVVLLAVSPVLRTLTESTTSDSIWALSVVLFFLHLTLADYSSSTKPHVQKEASGLSDTLSFNAAMSASVVLASRLNTDSETFTLLALATMLFAPSTKLKPAAAEARGAGKTECIPFASAYVMTMATAMLFKFIVEEEEEVGWVGIVVVWVHLVVGFVSVVCPWWIVRAQRWKMEIKGPWDPAKPVITSK